MEFTEGQGQDQYEEKIAFSLQILKAFVMTRDMIIHGEDAVKLRRVSSCLSLKLCIRDENASLVCFRCFLIY